MEPCETYEHAGVKVEIHYDDDGQGCNPREWENVTTFVCWHPDYVLGDYQFRSPNERGAVETPFRDSGNGRGFPSMEVLHRYITLVCGGLRVTPLYLYDHSGISMSAGTPSPFWMDGQGWDTTMVGFAYCTDEDITRGCGDGAAYRTDEWMDEAIRTDVAEYDKYLRGEVYGYVVAPGTEDEDSCWGFLGDEYVKQEANEAAEYVAETVAERERTRRLYLMAPETLTKGA
jgi:hypothetical protein